MTGVGREIRLYGDDGGKGADIWEGEFYENELNGFGRHIKVHSPGCFEVYMGYFKGSW